MKNSARRFRVRLQNVPEEKAYLKNRGYGNKNEALCLKREVAIRRADGLNARMNGFDKFQAGIEQVE